MGDAFTSVQQVCPARSFPRVPALHGWQPSACCRSSPALHGVGEAIRDAERRRAKLALDKGSYRTAVDAILAGVKLSPTAFGIADGLANTMKRTTRRLRRRLAKKAGLLKKLDQQLRALGVAQGE